MKLLSTLILSLVIAYSVIKYLNSKLPNTKNVELSICGFQHQGIHAQISNQYLFQIQQTINQSINSLLKEQPEDPYSYLIGILQTKSTPDIEIVDLQLFQVVSAEGNPVIKIKVTAISLSQTLQFYIDQPLGISSEENNTFDSEGLNSKGMKTMVQFYNEKIKSLIQQKKFRCSEQDQLDAELSKVYSESQQKFLYLVNSISFASPSIKSRVFSKPLYLVFSEMAERGEISPEESPKFMINCLQGGKTIGSKCKVFKYYLISEKHEGLGLIQTALQNIRKSITSGKGGEAALKYSPDSTFICPVDTIMDNLKIVEEAINTTPGAKEYLTIGLSWAADTLFNADAKKYELENPKTPFDSEQMIEYLIKLLTDKPMISYLEDPLASSEIATWSKLISKVRQTESIKHVKFGTRNGKLLNLFNEDDLKSKLQEISVPVTSDSHPDMSPEDRQAKNAEKFSLDYVQIRAQELQTVTNLIKVNNLLKKTSTQLILQDDCIETSNTDLVDLCYGLGCLCNLGSVVKYDRVSKINRAAEISNENHAEQKPQE